jgi:hypothetical protein
VLAPVGTDAFTVNLYSQTNAAGSVLSTGTTSYTVVAGVTNNVAITLGGQIATLSVTLSQSTFAAGTPATATVAVTALDAGGNAIALPGNYASPVTLVDSDTSGATTLSTTSLAAPGATATLSYNGSNGLAGSTVAVTASAAGATNGVGTLSIGSPSVTETLTLPAAGSALPVPAPTGYALAMTMPSTLNAPAGTTMRTTAAVAAPTNVPVLASLGRAAQTVRSPLSGSTTYMYVAFTPSANITASGTTTATYSFPGIVAGQQYFIAVYDASNSAGWQYQVVGPGVVNAAATQVTFTTNLGVTLVAGGLYAFTVYTPASIVTPSPSPTPTAPPPTPTPTPTAPPPTPTPTPTAKPVLVASPAAVNFGATTDPAQTVTVTEAGYTGAFSQSNTCGSGSTAIAVVTATTGAPGSQAYKVAPGTTAGVCTMTVSDGSGNSVAVPITLTTTTFPIN